MHVEKLSGCGDISFRVEMNRPTCLKCKGYHDAGHSEDDQIHLLLEENKKLRSMLETVRAVVCDPDLLSSSNIKETEGKALTEPQNYKENPGWGKQCTSMLGQANFYLCEKPRSSSEETCVGEKEVMQENEKLATPMEDSSVTCINTTLFIEGLQSDSSVVLASDKCGLVGEYSSFPFENDCKTETWLPENILAASTPKEVKSSKSGKPRKNEVAGVTVRKIQETSFDRLPKRASPTYKYKSSPVRTKRGRAQLNGYDCKMCKELYECVHPCTEERESVIQRVSRHRSKFRRNNTPDDFWNPGMPD